MQPSWTAPPPASPESSTNGYAIAALVMGILGVSCLPLIGSLVALPLGHVGLAHIRRSGGRQNGRGLAVAGLVLGYLVVGFALVVLAGNLVLQFVE
jgi:hypothetical protein